MVDWFQALAGFLTQSLEHGNLSVLAVLFLISTVVEIGVPVPWVQDTVLLFLGYGPSQLLNVAPMVVLCLMAGRIAGASIVFWVARRFEPRFTRWLGRKFPRILNRARDLGDKLGKRSALAVTIARLTPGLLTPSTIAAGLFKVRYPYFCIGVVISSLIPDIIEIASGIAVKAGVTFAGVTPTPSIFIVALITLMAVIWLFSWLWNRRHRDN
jgi:membrane protein DedA with SNARE-associated domain